MYNGDMRRSDREVTDIPTLLSWLDSFDVCRIGMVDEGKAYIVPVNFGYVYENGLTLYFHSAKAGRKMDILKAHPDVCFEMDGKHVLKDADIACDVTMDFVSVMGEGTIEFITDLEAKKAALTHILRHQTHRTEFALPDERVQAVAVYQLNVRTWSAKQHK